MPKESFLEESKALRKYKDLIKPNNGNRYNYCLSNRYNFEKQLNYDEIKDNTLSEIPIKNENIFEDELSKSEFNFNIQSPNKNKLNNNINEENKKNINDLNNKEINYIKKNLLNNIDGQNNNIINNNNLKSEKFLENKNNVNNNNLNNIINKSNNNSIDEYNNINIIKLSNEIPFFSLYYEQINSETNEKKDEEDKSNLNEIEKTNLILVKDNNIISDNKINEYSWYCLDYFNDTEEKIYNEFFNNEKI